MRKLSISLLFGLILSMCFMAYADETQSEIASGVVRLHIIANSDEEGDQTVKLLVRDEIIKTLSEPLQAAACPSDAERIIFENLDAAEASANRVLAQNGYTYRAAAFLGETHFPVKQYENITLPPGNYRALRIILGSGGGQNWWCVMYPPLCFTNCAQGNAPQESQDALRSFLGDENYALVTHAGGGELPVQIKFKILEIFDAICK